MQVLAISNAKARAIAKKGPQIKTTHLPNGAVHHITHNHEDLTAILRKAAEKQKLKHLIIEGGDGTVRTVMTALMSSYDQAHTLPAISILPGGTTNQIARNIGVKKITDLKRISQGHRKIIETPLVQIKIPDQKNRFGFLFSTGALPYVSKFAQTKLNEKGVGGGSAVLGAVLKAVCSDREALMPPQQHSMRAKIGDTKITSHEGKILGTVMTTLPYLMMGLDPFWGTEDAALRLTWAEAESQKLARTIASLWIGRKQDRSAAGYHSHNVDQITIKTKAPTVLDGDFIDLEDISFTVTTSRPVTFWQAN